MAPYAMPSMVPTTASLTMALRQLAVSQVEPIQHMMMYDVRLYAETSTPLRLVQNRKGISYCRNVSLRQLY